jgi:hypothetical protein
MQIGIKQISIGERIQAAQIQPNSTDTSSVPSSINPSPGDSTIASPDTSGLDSAGANINQQTQQGNKATSDSARKTNNPANQNVQYDRQTVSSEDQAPTAPTEKELSNTPPPKSKGFKESLIDQQMSSMMANKTGGDRGTIDRDFGHNNGDPNENIKKAPEGEPIRRDKIAQYDNSNNKVPEPTAFPITTFNKTNSMSPYKAPQQDLGPTYKQQNLATPKAPATKVRFNSPKINTPRFN